MKNEINLNHLTTYEYGKHKDNFEQYKKDVIALFLPADTFHFESDILKEYKAKSMNEVLATHPDKFVEIGSRTKSKPNECEKTWYDLSQVYIVTPKDPTYDLFLIYWLRNLDLKNIDGFLSHHLEKYFDGNFINFHRLLLLAIRENGEKLLTSKQVDTINEWKTQTASTQQEVSATKTVKRNKSKTKRESEDSLTCLNQEQTALLIYYMQNAKLILKNEYLNNTEAGQAFSILTGYSNETLRQELGHCKIAENVSKKNLNEVHNAIKQLLLVAESALNQRK